MISKIESLFVNTFTADDKYSLLNRENSVQPIQMQLSQKEKIFPDFLIIAKTIEFETVSVSDMENLKTVC